MKTDSSNLFALNLSQYNKQEDRAYQEQQTASDRAYAEEQAQKQLEQKYNYTY
jgi:hypothetical protein